MGLSQVIDYMARSDFVFDAVVKTLGGVSHLHFRQEFIEAQPLAGQRSHTIHPYPRAYTETPSAYTKLLLKKLAG